jgi:hypothetical protein
VAPQLPASQHSPALLGGTGIQAASAHGDAPALEATASTEAGQPAAPLHMGTGRWRAVLPMLAREVPGALRPLLQDERLAAQIGLQPTAAADPRVQSLLQAVAFTLLFDHGEHVDAAMYDADAMRANAPSLLAIESAQQASKAQRWAPQRRRAVKAVRRARQRAEAMTAECLKSVRALQHATSECAAGLAETLG